MKIVSSSSSVSISSLFELENFTLHLSRENLNLIFYYGLITEITKKILYIDYLDKDVFFIKQRKINKYFIPWTTLIEEKAIRILVP